MQKKTAQAVRCDVAVLGGGVSGVVAALAAARQGAHVLLVEREDFLGGVLVSGLGTLGFKDRAGNTVIGGIAQQVISLHRSKKRCVYIHLISLRCFHFGGIALHIFQQFFFLHPRHGEDQRGGL